MLEAIDRIEQMSEKKLSWRYVEEERKGDHICYISNLGKFRKDYPNWKITRGLDTILEEIIASQREHMK
jgi:CDP-paratose 2-epimerase